MLQSKQITLMVHTLMVHIRPLTLSLCLLLLLLTTAHADPYTLPEILKAYKQPYVILPSTDSPVYITTNGQIITSTNTKTAINTPTNNNNLINYTEKTTTITQTIYATLIPLAPPETITLDLNPDSPPPLSTILDLIKDLVVITQKDNHLIIQQRWKAVKNLANEEITGTYEDLLKTALEDLRKEQEKKKNLKLIYPLIQPADLLNICAIHNLTCLPTADAFLVEDHPALQPYTKPTKPRFHIRAYILTLTAQAKKELEASLSLSLSQAPIPQFYQGETTLTNTLNFTLKTQRGILNLIELNLKALQEKNQARILSSPSLYLDDRETATIKQGYEIPVITPATQTTPATTTYKTASLSLSVSPHLLPNGKVKLNLTITKDSPDFSREIQGNLPIITNTLNTAITIEVGKPYILGGILEETESKTKQTPAIPILEWIFGKRQTTTQSQELYIILYVDIAEEDSHEKESFKPTDNNGKP